MYCTFGEWERLREEGFAELVVQLHVPEGQTLDEAKEATLSKFAAIKPNTEYGARRFEMYARSMGYEQCALCRSGHVTPGVFVPSTALRKNETLHRLKSTSKVWVFRETQGLRRAIKAPKTLKVNNLVSVEGAVCQRCWLSLGKARQAPKAGTPEPPPPRPGPTSSPGQTSPRAPYFSVQPLTL